jgi:hypothetical protein
MHFLQIAKNRKTAKNLSALKKRTVVSAGYVVDSQIYSLHWAKLQ